MNFVKTADKKLSSIGLYFRQHKCAALWTGFGLYTFIFLLISALLFLEPAIQTGSFLYGDAVSQNYALLINFRRAELNFFEALSNGSFELGMLDLNFSINSDITVSSVYLLAPILPVFMFVGLVPETGVALFLSIATLALAYVSGITFILMCRHFRLNTIWAGIFAYLYSCGGYYFYTALFNMHFVYMMIFFPIMIIGIDKIINDKDSITLAVSVFLLSLGGVTLALYSLPFVVIFAIIRVYYVKKENYFKNLLKYFLRGFVFTALGVLSASVMLLPTLYATLNSARQVNSNGVNILSLFLPSLENVEFLLSQNMLSDFTSLSAVLIPALMFSILAPYGNKQLRSYAATLFALLAFPFFRFALNGFQYSLCRWGFTASLLACFLTVYYVPRIARIKKADLITLISTFTVYILLFAAISSDAAAIWIIVCVVINLIAPLRKLLLNLFSRAAKFMLKHIKHMKDTNLYGLLAIIAVVLAVTGFLIYFILSWGRGLMVVIFFIITVSTGVILFLARRKIIRRGFTGVLVIVCASVLMFLQYSNCKTKYEYVATDSELYQSLSQLEVADNHIGRMASTSEEESTLTSEYEVNGIKVIDNDKSLIFVEQANASLRYGLRLVETFNNIIDRDYMNLLTRSEMDSFSLSTSVSCYSYARRESLYSLFGVEYIYSDYNGINPSTYGLEKTTDLMGKDFNASVYRNNYALPIGFTYDTTIDKDAFSALNSVDLSYAMMNGVYLENSDLSLNSAAASYSRLVDHTLTQTERGVTSMGIDCYDNHITINDDVSDGFLYIRFKNVYALATKSESYETCIITTDTDNIIGFSVENCKSGWPWRYSRDNYTVSLGYSKDGIKTLDFPSPFEFDEIELYYVPRTTFTDAYSSRCEEILEDVKIGTNTIEGNITVSSQKVLVLSFLHNDGWTAYVDGEKTEIYKANDIFLGLILDKGSHNVRIEYRTPWLYEGAVISLISVGVLITIAIIGARKKKISK